MAAPSSSIGPTGKKPNPITGSHWRSEIQYIGRTALSCSVHLPVHTENMFLKGWTCVVNEIESPAFQYTFGRMKLLACEVKVLRTNVPCWATDQGPQARVSRILDRMVAVNATDEVDSRTCPGVRHFSSIPVLGHTSFVVISCVTSAELRHLWYRTIHSILVDS